MASLWYAPRTLSGVAGAVQAFVGLEQFFRETSGLYLAPRLVTAATTLLGSDRLLLVTTTGGAVTVTLRSAKEYAPGPYAVKLLAGANNVTLDADGSENIHTTAGAGTLVWNTTGMTKIIWPYLTASPGVWAWAELNT